MHKTKIMLWLKRKETRRIRLVIASISILIIVTATIIILSGLLPRFIMTIGGRLSLKTPDGFTVGSMYSFSKDAETSSELSAAAGEAALPFLNAKEIPFKYPGIINLGVPSYMDDELIQSMDFKLENPSANGLIQIWNLVGSINDILNRTIESSNMTYLTFKSSQSDIQGFKCISWDYTFESGGANIHGLEAFIEDDPYLYRISMFIPEKNYTDNVLKTFNETVNSVSIK